MMSLIFDETEDDYTDIYKCGSFSPIDKEIETEWSSISFYEEDKVNYLPTAKNFQDERLSTKAVKEIETEIENEGILSADFCVEWYENYEKLQKVIDKLHENEIEVSLFIDPNEEIIELSSQLEVEFIELHTGTFANIYAMLHSNLAQTHHSIKELEL